MFRWPTLEVCRAVYSGGGERRERTFASQFVFPPIVARNGLTRLVKDNLPSARGEYNCH